MKLCLTLLALLTLGCTSAYWDRPGATLPQLAEEAEACYRAAVNVESPAALAVTDNGPALLPRTEPPPKLWARAPKQAALERVDEQLQYERCMRARGWRAARIPPPGS